MRCAKISILLSLTALTLGCGDDPGPGDGGGTDGGSADDGGTDGGGEDVTPVWDESRIETNASLSGVCATSTGVYVVADAGRSWSRSGGSWDVLVTDVDGVNLNGMWCDGEGEALSMVAVGDEGWIESWIGGGWIGDDIGTANLESVHGADSTNLMAVGFAGIYQNLTGDWEWQSDVPTNYRFWDAWYNGANAFVVGEDGVVGMWTSGEGWTFEQTTERRPLYAVWAVSSTEAYAVGERGTVLKYDGATWTAVEGLGTDVTFWDVWAPTSTAVYVVGNNGKAFKYNGTAWAELPTGVENNLYAVHGSSGTNVWAVGNRGMALHYVEE